ncbi:MAG: class I SAM-dependent methyltransferase [Chloroflexales bacterium]
MINRLYPPHTSTRYYSLTRLREAIERVIASRLPPGVITLVDLGCGAMPYRPLFAPHVARYIGVDLIDNPQADLHMPADGRVPIADGAVDVVLSSQVLEHVTSPAAYLAECRRILRPGGILILSTHGYWLYHPNPTDYWRWTGSGLARQLALAGLEIQHHEGIMGLGAAALQLLQDALTLPIPQRLPLRPPVGLVFQALVALADACYSPAQRASDACIYLMVARRPPAEVWL